MGKASGLRFSESLSGYLAESPDFREGYRQGRQENQWAQFWVTVTIPDLDRFLEDPEHTAKMTGRVAVRGLGRARLEDASLLLFCRRDGGKRLLYRLPFTLGEERYLLCGEKRLMNPRGLRVWRQMTTLYTELRRRNGDAEDEVFRRGILRIGPGRVLLQSLSFRPVGESGRLRAAGDYARFLRFASREVRTA